MEPVPSTSTTDHRPVNETPVHPVEPVLGTTPSENHRLQDRNRPQQHMKGMYKLRFKLLMACMLINQSIFYL